jgi:hypothetical protein
MVGGVPKIRKPEPYQPGGPHRIAEEIAGDGERWVENAFHIPGTGARFFTAVMGTIPIWGYPGLPCRRHIGRTC